MYHYIGYAFLSLFLSTGGGYFASFYVSCVFLLVKSSLFRSANMLFLEGVVQPDVYTFVDRHSIASTRRYFAAQTACAKVMDGETRIQGENREKKRISGDEKIVENEKERFTRVSRW